MSKITDEIVKEEFKGGDYTFIHTLLIVSSVIVAAIFIGETLFGKNSLEVYLSLKKDKVHLTQKIDKLQHQNAALQKEFFELNSLFPDEESP
jgi:cell division protein FtsB